MTSDADLVSGLDEESPLLIVQHKSNRKCDKTVLRNIVVETSPEAKRRRLDSARADLVRRDEFSRKRSDTSMICGEESQALVGPTETQSLHFTRSLSSATETAEDLIDQFEDIWLSTCKDPIRSRKTRKLCALLEAAITLLRESKPEPRLSSAFHSLGWELVVMALSETTGNIDINQSRAVLKFIAILAQHDLMCLMLPATSFSPPVSFTSLHPMITRYTKDGIYLNQGPIVWLSHMLIVRPDGDIDTTAPIRCPLCRLAEIDVLTEEPLRTLIQTLSMMALNIRSYNSGVFIVYLVLPIILCPPVCNLLLSSVTVDLKERNITRIQQRIDVLSLLATIKGNPAMAHFEGSKTSSCSKCIHHNIVGKIRSDTMSILFNHLCALSCIRILDSEFHYIFVSIQKLKRYCASPYKLLRQDEISTHHTLCSMYLILMLSAFSLACHLESVWDTELTVARSTDIDSMLTGPDGYVFCLHPCHTKVQCDESTAVLHCTRVRIPASLALLMYRDNPDLRAACPTESCSQSRVLSQSCTNQLIDLNTFAHTENIPETLKVMSNGILRQIRGSLRLLAKTSFMQILTNS